MLQQTCGCVVFELFTDKPLFDGEYDIEQLSKIYRALGTIDLASYPSAEDLPDFLRREEHVLVVGDAELVCGVFPRGAAWGGKSKNELRRETTPTSYTFPRGDERQIAARLIRGNAELPYSLDWCWCLDR